MQRYVVSLGILICLLFLSIWPFEQFTEFHNSQRLVSTVLVAVALILSIWFAKVSSRTLRMIACAYLWAGICILSSPLPLWSLLEFGLLSSVVVLGITLMPKVDKFQISTLAAIFVIIQTFYVVHNLTAYSVVLITKSAFQPFSLSNGFSNVRFYGQFLIWTVPFVLGVVSSNPKTPYRSFVVAILMFGWAFEFLTLTRAYMLGMIVSFSVVWWVAKGGASQYLKWLLITAVGGFIIYLIMLFVLPNIFGVVIEEALSQSIGRDMLNSSGRVQLWRDAIDLMLQYPWFGAGPMMTALVSVSKIAAHPHNYLLQLLAEWGIPFTLLLSGGVIYGAIKWKKLVNFNAPERIPYAVPATAALSAGAGAGLVDGLIVMPVSLVYLTLLLAVVAGLWREWTPSELRRSFPKWSIPILLTPAIFAANFSIINWAHWIAEKSVPTAMAGKGYHLQMDSSPRFWIFGHIVQDVADGH